MIASNQLVQNCNEPQRSFNDKKIHKDQFLMVDYLVFVWFQTCTHISAEYLNYSCVFFIFTKLQSYARERNFIIASYFTLSWLSLGVLLFNYLIINVSSILARHFYWKILSRDAKHIENIFVYKNSHYFHLYYIM